MTFVLNSANKPLSYSAAPDTIMLALSGAAKLTSTGGNVLLQAPGAQTVMVGGGGDDTFVVLSDTNQITSQPNQGIDTVISYTSNYTLAANVQNLMVEIGTGTGNGADNIITAAGGGAITLNGGGGNDVLVGGSGPDRFIVTGGQGNDVIMQFTAAADVVELDGVSGLSTFAQVQAHMAQQGNDVVLNMGSGQNLTFRNMVVSQFSAANFSLPFSLTDFTLPSHKTGLVETFDEEFNNLSASASGSGTTWRTTMGSNRTLSNNNEIQYYSDTSVGVNPFTINNGILTITATPATAGSTLPAGLTYTSGALTTQKSFSQLYGYFEMRAELPSGAGMWPAFWLLPANGSWPPELDAMEVLGGSTDTLYTTLHSATLTSTAGHSLGFSTLTTDLSVGFHTYGVLWTATDLSWYLDGQLVASAVTPSDMNTAMYMLVNLAVGGTGSWPGPAAGETDTMQVDYVRAYQLPAAVTHPTNAVITGAVYMDGNADNTRQLTEEGVSGVGVKLVTGAGTVIATTVTDAQGNFSFGGVAPGGATYASSYKVLITPPPNDFLGVASAGTVGPFSLTAGQTKAIAPIAVQSLVITVTGAKQAYVLGSHNYTITGEMDASTITTGAGNQTFIINGGANTITTGAGNETITLFGNNNVITLGAGNSSLTGYGGANIITTGAGNQTITLSGSGNHVTVGAGISTLKLNGDNTVLSMGAVTAGGISTVALQGYTAQILATGNGNFQITGSGGNDGAIVTLLNGNSTISLNGLRNTVSTGIGNETITLAGDYATVTTGAGNQTVSLNGYGSKLTIGTGVSTVSAIGSNAVINLAGVTAGATTSIAISGYNDSITATGTGNFKITDTAGSGNTSVALLQTGNNTITLSGGTNTVRLGAGNQTISLSGYGNRIGVGVGVSTISALGGGAVVFLGGITAGATSSVVLGGYNNTVTANGAGSVKVTDTGVDNNTTVTLLAGNHTVTLAGGSNAVSLGAGNQTVSLSGVGNTVSTGLGISVISALGNRAQVALAGVTVGGTTSVTLNGAGDSVTEAAAGNVKLSSTGGTATISLAAGTHTLTLSGNYNTVSLGAGNQTVTATSDYNSITTAAGNQKITITGYSNRLTVGAGASTITESGNNATITVGAVTAGGKTTITLSGYNEIVTATGAGNFIISNSGTGGNSTLNLLNGNHAISMIGYGNTINVGQGTSVISALNGGATIHAGGGADTITVSGYNNILDAGPGSNILNGGAGNDAFVLNAANQGKDTITGFKFYISDVLDLTRTLAGTAIAADLSNITKFISTTSAGGNTTLYVDATGGSGTPYAFAVLQGITTTMTALTTQHSFRVNGHLT